MGQRASEKVIKQIESWIIQIQGTIRTRLWRLQLADDGSESDSTSIERNECEKKRKASNKHKQNKRNYIVQETKIQMLYLTLSVVWVCVCSVHFTAILQWEFQSQGQPKTFAEYILQLLLRFPFASTFALREVAFPRGSARALYLYL